MFAGTGSDVGKSIIAAAFCRILLQDGWRPAPFKAQNMALNSFVTPQGLEIGRAQAVQAEAAGIECHSDMNPVLLKPSSDHTSQVIVNGRAIGNRSAKEYFCRQGKDDLRAAACAAYDRLASAYNPIVMEGAGSISELNLSDRDIVNMPMAVHAGAAVILVANIDRGGVFASVYGSIMLQPEDCRHLIKGIIINKFRGDISLFDSGRKILEDLCGVPVLGVIPYFKDIHIEEEDSVSLESKRREYEAGKVNIAVVLLKHLSNFTDFDALENDTRVNLFYTNNTEDLQKADIIIVPGTKSTLSDLGELRRNGVAKAIRDAYRDGTTIIGICGGYQILGEEICDPNHVEGPLDRLPGIGILPVRTVITGEKITRRVSFVLSDRVDVEGAGYEIHMGRTELTAVGAKPLAIKDDGSPEGCLEGHAVGTYIHGILDNVSFIDFILEPFASRLEGRESFDHTAFKQRQYDLLADHVRKNTDMKKFYEILRSHD